LRAVIGIGNPGSRYIRNRHNAGFLLLDYFAREHSLTFKASSGDYYYTRSEINSSGYILVKPSGYVNRSGISALQVKEKYKLDIKDILVLVDDINLPLAQMRVRESGGDGGHNGTSSIIYQLESDQFPRIRIGIGAGFEKGKMADYVLEDFTETEEILLIKSYKTGSELIKAFILEGIKGMLDFNSRIIPPPEGETDKA
jgi:PTH1 family peptidyl-tRNA hydrolase